MGLLLHLCFFFLLLGRAFALDASICSSKFSAARHVHLNNSSGIHFALHHPRSPCSPAPFAVPLPFSTVLSHDAARVQALTSRLSKTTATISRASSSPLLRPDAVSVPLSKGTSLGVGNYVTRIGLGTPSKSYAVVVDTGSSFSWVQCSPCRVYCHSQVGSVFDPSASSTYRSLPCSASECGGLESSTLNPPACSVSNVCIYEASYGDSSFSIGYLSEDVLSLARDLRLPGFVYGCGQDNEGLFGRSAGLIGLARNRLSLLSQLAPVTGNAFSYCLPSTSSSGYLSIGSYNPGRFSYTPLVSSSLDESLYFLRLTSITVDGRVISVPSSMQTIIDSGTVITRLPSDVYDALSRAVAAALKRYRRAPAYSILDTCFVGSLSKLAVPPVELIFQGGAALRLPAKNVMIDVDESTTCLAFAPSGDVAIIGNTQQQTFSVAYDVGRSRIGFAAGGCG
ncbi:aspartyl protease family protein At5g10770-like [Zingiber officinale]|uniref:aspartyl protease family protein At5g10770-like n=1 Tax=Zingiber officinale TaxID=94328 RepID=UPI001C4B929D|nr:aspartyl protease family protein At5g10770-like [Zingiber officinale]